MSVQHTNQSGSGQSNGSNTGPGDDGGQQNQNGQQQQNGQNGQQSGDQNQSGGMGLLDGEANSQNDDGNQNTGNESGDGGQQQNGEEQQSGLTAQDVESAIDRRINAVLREVRSLKESNGQNGQGNQQQGGGGQQGRNQNQQQTSQGPDAGDIREARSSYREYVADELKFLGSQERSMARTIAESRITTALARGGDPDSVGREVAESVAQEIKGLREFYEGRVINALRRNGTLPQNNGSQQQAQPGQGQGGVGAGSPAGQAGTSWAKGQSKANEMFANRFPQQG